MLLPDLQNYLSFSKIVAHSCNILCGSITNIIKPPANKWELKMRFSKVMKDNKQGSMSARYFGQFLPSITQISTDTGSSS